MARTGCAYCFATLDRNDTADGRRPVACGACGRPYHEHCLAQACAARCVVPLCASVVPPVAHALEATTPVLLAWMAGDPHAGGPANTIDDAPVGLSSGMAGDVGGDTVGVRNNGREPLWVPRLFFGPPWADVQLAPAPEELPERAPEIASHHTVAPKETKVLHVRLAAARPVWAEQSLRLAGQEVVICSSPFTGVFLFFALVGLFAVLLLHLVTTMIEATSPEPNYWRPAATFGLALGYTALLSPGWLRGCALFLLDALFSRIDLLLTSSRPVATAYNWLNAAEAGVAGRRARLVLLAALAGVLAALAHRALPSWAAVSALAAASDGTLAFIGAGLAYGFVLLALWSWWLSKFGLFDWLWNAIARRVGGLAPVSAPASMPAATSRTS